MWKTEYFRVHVFIVLLEGFITFNRDLEPWALLENVHLHACFQYELSSCFNNTVIFKLCFFSSGF